MRLHEAFKYYEEFIHSERKNSILKEYKFKINGTVHSTEWEVFCAILKNKKKKQQGADLIGYEVKSAKQGNSFEYQYHKINGLRKLKEDRNVSHLFVSYDNDYKDIVVREMSALDARHYFDLWETQMVDNYKTGKQRFRKSLPYSFVVNNSKIILKIKNKIIDIE